MIQLARGDCLPQPRASLSGLLSGMLRTFSFPLNISELGCGNHHCLGMWPASVSTAVSTEEHVGMNMTAQVSDEL